MAFDKQYPDPCRWSFILPFFGFEREKETRFRSRGVYISDSDTLSGKRKVYGRESYDEDVFVRTKIPTGRERELEDEFIRIVSSSNEKLFAGIETSLEGFYRNKQSCKLPSFRPIFKIIAAILIGVWFLPYSYTFPLFKQRFGYDTASVLFVFPVPGTLFLAGWFIDKLRSRAYDRREDEILKGYSKLSYAQKEEIRQQYFAEMEKWYGKKAGAVLKEYAILKGYDRK